MLVNSTKRPCPLYCLIQLLTVSLRSAAFESNNCLTIFLLFLCAAEFEINEETKEYLKTLEGPIGVLSVAGMYRSGKSYLLNRVLLNRSRGFDVGHTINACTKVSIWCFVPVKAFPMRKLVWTAEMHHYSLSWILLSDRRPCHDLWMIRRDAIMSVSSRSDIPI